jgi:cytochrome c556
MIIAMATAALVTGLLAPDLAAKGEHQSVAAAQDVILARKTLMNAIEENSDRIARMISDRDIDLPEARARAGSMFVMLTAFPHLFPPNSNQWKEGADLDPATDTVASPEIWTNFSDFYELAAAAAERADEMRHATKEDDVKSLHRALGNLCDFCHALYYKE